MTRYTAIAKGVGKETKIQRYEIDDQLMALSEEEYDYYVCDIFQKSFGNKDYPDFIIKEDMKTGEKRYIRNYYHSLSTEVINSSRWYRHFFKLYLNKEADGYETRREC